MESLYEHQINQDSVGKNVTVAGWVSKRRDHGGVIFIDLRIANNIIQAVFNREDKDSFIIAERLRGFSTFSIKTVRFEILLFRTDFRRSKRLGRIGISNYL